MAAWSLRETKENAVIKECAAICRYGAMGSAATKLWPGPEWSPRRCATTANLTRSAAAPATLNGFLKESPMSRGASCSRDHRASAQCQRANNPGEELCQWRERLEDALTSTKDPRKAQATVVAHRAACAGMRAVFERESPKSSRPPSPALPRRIG